MLNRTNATYTTIKRSRDQKNKRSKNKQSRTSQIWLHFQTLQPNTPRRANNTTKRTQVLWLFWIKWGRNKLAIYSFLFSLTSYKPWMDSKFTKVYYSPRGIAAIKKISQGCGSPRRNCQAIVNQTSSLVDLPLHTLLHSSPKIWCINTQFSPPRRPSFSVTRESAKWSQGLQNTRWPLSTGLVGHRRWSSDLLRFYWSCRRFSVNLTSVVLSRWSCLASKLQ